MFFLNYCIGFFQSLQMAFLKVNCKEPVESIPVSSLLLFSPGCFKVFVILLEPLIRDYTALSCVCTNSLSQTIVNTAFLKHIALHESGLKENIYLFLSVLILSSYLKEHFHQ